MTIQEVKQKTGLTKKAINYYELKGLINPSYNTENRYRNFSETDLKKLSIIGLLRQLNIPIEKIKYVIEKKISIDELLKQHITELNNNIELLKDEIELINQYTDKHKNLKLNDINIKEIINKKKKIELNQFKRKNFINSQWQKIFPGKLGKLFSIIYNTYLQDPINTKEKEKAWNLFVEYLDNIKSIEIPEEINEILNSEVFNKILHETKTENFASSFNYIKELEKEQIKSEDVIPLTSKNLTITKDKIELLKKVIKLKIFINEVFKEHSPHLDKHLKTLSSSYIKYKENMNYLSNLLKEKEDYKSLFEKYSEIKNEINLSGL